MATMGNTSASYSQYNNADANYKRATRFLCSDTGAIATQYLHCSCDAGGAGTWKAVIFADSSSEPGALLGTSGEVSVAAGSSKAWRAATFSSPVSVTSGSYYWLGFISGNGYLNYGVTTGTAATGAYNADTYSGGAANPFGAHSHLDPPKILTYGVITSGAAAPNAPTLTAPTAGSTIDYRTAQTFQWTFSAVTAGDTQSAYTLRYKLTSAGSWTTLSEVISPVGSHVFAASTCAAGDYEWQVLTDGATGLAGPYSASGTFTAGTTADTPVITDPTNLGTVTTNPYVVVWTCPDQADGYQVRTVADNAGSPDTGTVYQDTGTVASATARSQSMTFDTNTRTEHIQVRVNNGGWSNWASVKITVSYEAPEIPTCALVADSTNGRISVTATHPDPSIDVAYSSVVADGILQKYSAVNWATMLAETPTASAAGNSITATRTSSGGNFGIYRGFISIDISALAAQPARATLTVTVQNDSPTGTFTLYYQDWGAALAAADWVAEGTLTAASAAFAAPAAGELVIELINLGSLLASNGRFVLICADETTEPVGDKWMSFDSYEVGATAPELGTSVAPTVTSEDIYRSTESDGTGAIRIKAANTPEAVYYDYAIASDVNYYYLIRAIGDNTTTTDSAWTG